MKRKAMMAQRLWLQAERDLEAATLNAQPRFFYVAANLAHQAAEKALKAACWHVLGEEPPWVHDIGKVVERMAERSGGVPQEVNEAIRQLDPMFERSRYPSGNVDEPIPADLVGEQDAQEAVRSAEEIMAWVKKLLRRP